MFIPRPLREDLCRSAPFTLTRATDEGSDGLTIEGYGAVFNSVTRINSGWEGDFEEVIAPGAFKRSLKARVPLMQFDHGQHPLLGSLPLGRWMVAEEDERGLHLVGRLTDNWLVTPFRDAIRDGGVKGMSFRFAVVQDDWTDAAGKRLRDNELAGLLYNGAGDRGPIRRTLREVRASEAGPVVHPAYEDTVVGVRSRDGKVVIDLGRLHEPVQREQLAKIVALADRGTLNALCDTDSYSQVSRLAQGTTWSAEERQQATVRTLIDAGYTPESVVAHVMQGEPLQHTGKFSVQLQPERSTEPTPVEASPPADVPVGSPNVEQQIEIQPDPQSTATSPDDHSAQRADPEVTDHAPGEHSAPARPVNPVERRELIRKEFRAVTNRVLALPRHQPPKENSA
jgi:HK97 family phage prohead protease